MALGLLAGLLQGSGTALLVDRRKGLIWNEADLMHILGLPILVELDQISNLMKRSLTTVGLQRFRFPKYRPQL